MGRPLVSILVTAYKSNIAYLTSALQSALAQTCTDIEILVGDNSPTNALQSLIESFGDRRLHYHHNNPAVDMAENYWLRFCASSGKYVTTLHHDDHFSPTFVETLVAPLERHDDVVVAFCDHWIIDAAGQADLDKSARQSRDYGRTQLAAGLHKPLHHLVASQSISINASVFRRDAIVDSSLRSAGTAYDLWLAYLLGKTGGGAFYIQERLSSWRSHAQSASRTTGTEFLPNCLADANCWRAIARDAQYESINPTARRKAADALALAAWISYRAGRRSDCFARGREALDMRASAKSLAVCLLPLVPVGVAERLVALYRARTDG